MYGLLLAVTTKGVALGVTVLNRLTITISSRGSAPGRRALSALQLAARAEDRSRVSRAFALAFRPPSGRKTNHKNSPSRLRFRPTQPSDFGLAPTVLRFSFDLLALRARRNRQPTGSSDLVQDPRRRNSAAFCEVAKSGRNELVAKSEDQSSAEFARRRQNHTAPPSAATPAAIALFFGSRSSLDTVDFAFRFAAILLTVHTAQPRRAFRLLMTLMTRAYPSRQPSTQKVGRRPPERRPMERGVRPEPRGGRARAAHTQKTPARAKTYALLSGPFSGSVLGEERRKRVRQRHLGECAQRDPLCALAAVQALAVVALADVDAEDSALASGEQAVEVARDRSFGFAACKGVLDLRRARRRGR